MGLFSPIKVRAYSGQVNDWVLAHVWVTVGFIDLQTHPVVTSQFLDVYSEQMYLTPSESPNSLWA